MASRSELVSLRLRTDLCPFRGERWCHAVTDAGSQGLPVAWSRTRATPRGRLSPRRHHGMRIFLIGGGATPPRLTTLSSALLAVWWSRSSWTMGTTPRSTAGVADCVRRVPPRREWSSSRLSALPASAIGKDLATRVQHAPRPPQCDLQEHSWQGQAVRSRH